MVKVVGEVKVGDSGLTVYLVRLLFLKDRREKTNEYG